MLVGSANFRKGALYSALALNLIEVIIFYAQERVIVDTVVPYAVDSHLSNESLLSTIQTIEIFPL